MAKRHIHIVGAGMAGLSAALQLALAGEKITLYEATPFAGGRCRSFHDRDLDCRLDNGNHLVLSGNVGIGDYLFLSGAEDTMGGPGKPVFPFMDLQTGERWITQMNMGRMPWWLFDSKRRVKGTGIVDYLSAIKVLTAGAYDTVLQRLDARTMLYHRFWEPLVIGALNTEPDIASAALLANIFVQTFGRGGRACIPLIPKIGLSETFVEPCLKVLQQHNVETKFSHRLRAIKIENKCIREMEFNGAKIEVGAEDWVILALPAWAAREIVPEISMPTEFRSILNIHYRVNVPNNGAGFTGLIGGIAEWCFVRDGVASVTISCAERHKDKTARDMAAPVWGELAKLFDLDPQKVPPNKVFLEKYATFAATPEQNIRRPLAYDFRWRNMALAGEWTATELPSTIEGAIRSGLKAAQVVMRWA